MSRFFYIKKIIRNDKAKLEFDQFELYLDEENTLLTRPEIATTAIDYTEADGGEMIAQRLLSTEQPINGIIIPKTTDYWTLRNRLADFFKTGHNYFIVYEKKDGGGLFKSGAAWISENLQVPPEPREDFSRFTITLGIGSALYQEYAENESGEEIYTHNVDVGISTVTSGGLVWDARGLVWDEKLRWKGGNGGAQQIVLQSSVSVYPIWVVAGVSVSPEIRNDTNGTVATYAGTIGEGQTLTVDFSTGTADLDGVNVTRNLKGELRLDPGANKVAFETGGAVRSSTIKWNNYTS